MGKFIVLKTRGSEKHAVLKSSIIRVSREEIDRETVISVRVSGIEKCIDYYLSVENNSVEKILKEIEEDEPHKIPDDMVLIRKTDLNFLQSMPKLLSHYEDIAKQFIPELI